MSDDTIFALATGQVKAALAIVRVSGRDAASAVLAIAGRLPPPRRATLRTLRHPGTGETLDEGLVLWFPGPATATGEDVTEFHLHGGHGVSAGVLDALAFLPGLRAAAPGEFTLRAVRNGRMDLTQAEALADLIDAETNLQRRQALGQMGGRLRDRSEAWRAALVEALALLDADLDFADEEDVAGSPGLEIVCQHLRTMRDDFAAVLADHSGERIRSGVTIVIGGAPNAGKSSLLNALAGRDVAIVTPIPGTTRDTLEVHLEFAGVPATLVDTAGLRETADEVERIGVERARRRAGEADLLLWLSPADAPTSPPSAWLPRGCLVIQTKVDLPSRSASVPPDLSVSVVTGEGLDDLRARLASEVAQRVGSEPGMVTRERHRRMIGAANAALGRGLALLHDASRLELAAEEVRRAIRALDALVGRVDVEDVLDAIFSRFCIGK